MKTSNVLIQDVAFVAEKCVSNLFLATYLIALTAGTVWTAYITDGYLSALLPWVACYILSANSIRGEITVIDKIYRNTEVRNSPSPHKKRDADKLQVRKFAGNVFFYLSLILLFSCILASDSSIRSAVQQLKDGFNTIKPILYWVNAVFFVIGSLVFAGLYAREFLTDIFMKAGKVLSFCISTVKTWLQPVTDFRAKLSKKLRTIAEPIGD